MDENTNVGASLGTILSDPKLLGTLRTLLGNVASDTGNAHIEGTTPLSEGIGNVLSNPELLSKLPSVMAMLKPILESAPSPKETPDASDAKSVSAEPSQKEEAASVPTGAVFSPEHRAESKERYRKELLLALKPFLSRERCEAVDMILRLSALGSVLKHLQ